MSFEEFPLNEDFQGYTATSKVSPSTDPKKRRRIKPCFYCRRRKTKCVRDTNLNKCLECIKRKLDCFVDESPKVVSENKGCDNCRYRRKICLIQEDETSCFDCLVDHLTCINTDVNPIVIDKSQIGGERILVGFGSDKETNLIPWSSQQYTESTTSTRTIVRNGPILGQLFKDHTHQLHRSFLLEVESISGTYGNYLLGLFCKFFNPQIPIISKDQASMITKERIGTSSSNPLLITMICLHALKFSPLEPSSISFTVNKVQLENLAVILTTELKENSMEMIQGLILFIYYHFSENKEHNGMKWSILQKAIQIAEILGCHDSDGVHLFDKYKVILWEIIKLDGFISLVESKPRKTVLWSVEKLNSSSVKDLYYSSVFTEIIKLSQSYCEPLIMDLSSNRSIHQEQYSSFLEKSTKLINSTSQWYKELPPTLSSSIIINLHYYLLIFSNYRRLLDKAIQTRIPIEELIPVSDNIIKFSSSFNDILLNDETPLQSILQYQVLPKYLTHCFSNYYIVLKLLSKLNFNVTALLQSYKLKSRSLSKIEELKDIDFDYLESIQTEY